MNDSTTKIWLRLKLQPEHQRQNYSIVYRFTSDTSFQGKPTPLDFQQNEQYNYYSHIEFDKLTQDKICLIEVKDTLRLDYYFFPITLTNEFNFDEPNIILYRSGQDYPVFENYVSVTDSFQLASSDSMEVFFFLYRNDFQQADPPMKENSSPLKKLSIDSVFQVPIEQPFIFPKTGMYFIQQDTNSLVGLTIQVQDRYFPKPRKLDQLIESVIYISTREEMNNLKAENTKEALDRFWIKLATYKDRAKVVIRKYYARQEEANKLFTSYKEGWKTDRGMTYMIFGPPDKVNHRKNSELWQYDTNHQDNKLTFIFVRIKNIFSNQHYKLIREKDFKEGWYQKVEDWRKGRLGF